MQRFLVVGAASVCVLLFSSCSRKAPQAAPPAPEVLVTTVTPRDVPRVLERVATLDGFINANINAQVQGYIVSRDYQEGSVVKKGDLLFQIDPRPFEAALAQAKGTLAKDKANQVKADADEKRAIDLFKKKVISDSGARYCPRRCRARAEQMSKPTKQPCKQAELNLGYTKVTSPIDGVAGLRPRRWAIWSVQATGPSRPFRNLIRSKLSSTAGEGPFTDFVSRHPDPD